MIAILQNTVTYNGRVYRAGSYVTLPDDVLDYVDEPLAKGLDEAPVDKMIRRGRGRPPKIKELQEV